MFIALKETLKKCGVVAGDILYVSSDIKTFLFNAAESLGINKKDERNQLLNDFIDCFQETVTDKGTLLFPVFSWDWCRGHGFDVRKTKGEVGTLSNWVLANRKDFQRTQHPMYSFMVWGKDAELLKNMSNQDAWSHSSPFYYFLQNKNAKQLLFNIEAFQGLTFGHFVEQEVRVPYRHPKYFFGCYTDENGNTENRMYSMYVRDIEVESGCNVHNSWLIENKVATHGIWRDNKMVIVDLAKSYPLIKNDMLNNNGENTLIFTKGKLDWTQNQTVLYEIKGL
ncbi:MAG: AAC(3) family N-acetyltransferase [Synergistaceae bacterium]|nr:AAC(3) family N-acetyltransferase [Synergistaceae bacterium]